MNEIITLLEIQDFVWISGALAIVITSVVQACSKRYDPWLYILEKIGDAMNKKLIEKTNDLEKKVDKLEDQFKVREKKDECNKAKASRRRILRFADEIRLGHNHSQEFFNEVLNDIKTYQEYCDNNPEFENDKAVISIELIEETYKKCLQKNSFL